MKKVNCVFLRKSKIRLKIRKSKIRFTLMIAIIFLMLTASNCARYKNLEIKSYHNSRANTLISPTKAADHAPILIDGNAELASFASNESLSGDGTYDSPYIIEDLTFETSKALGIGIGIRNTDAYLIIQNCTFNGILSSNANFFNNKGIYIKNSSNVIINNNTLKNYGIFIQNSRNNTVFRNAVENNSYGIKLDHSSDNTLSENTVKNNGNGIDLKSSNKNTISWNIIEHNNEDGIKLDYSNNNTISWNSVSYGDHWGIHTGNSLNNTFYLNSICGNQYKQAVNRWYKHYVRNATDTWVLEGPEPVCLDNQWDNGSMGNYWGNDYVIKYPDASNDGTYWDAPYMIEDIIEDMIESCFRKDNFPLVNSIFPDKEAPSIIDFPEDIFKLAGYKNLKIDWTAIDVQQAKYTIEQDGVEMVSATTLINGDAISYSIPEKLPIGEYNITIFITDENGNQISDTVIFRIGNWFLYIMTPLIIISVVAIYIKKKYFSLAY